MSVATGARSNFERFVLDRQKQLSKQFGNKNYQISPEELQRATQEFFGDIPLPQGAKEISRTPYELRYQDADGRIYTAKRNIDGNLGTEVGKIETQLYQLPGTTPGNLVAAQSSAGELDYAKSLLGQIQDYIGKNLGQYNQLDGSKTPSELAGLNNSGIQSALDAVANSIGALNQNANKLQSQNGLAELDPSLRANLDAILQSNLAQLHQQFGDQSGALAAQLFGRGINRSSVAGTQAGRLLQQQGLVTQQALSDAASRELSTRQAISQLLQGNLALAGEQLAQGGQLGVQSGQITNQANQNTLGAFNAVNNYNLTSRAQSIDQAGQAIALLQSILQQAVARETSGAQLGQEQQQINNQQSQFERNYGLANAQYETQAAAQRQAANRQLWSSIIGGIASFALPFAGGLGGTLGGLFGNAAAKASTPALGPVVGGVAVG